MYTHILAPIDGSAISARAFEAAMQLAHDSDAEVTPLYVVDVPLIGADTPGYDPSVVRNALVGEGTNITAEAVAKMTAGGVKGSARVIETSSLGDDIAHCIVQVAREWPADLIVIGTHGRRGFRRLMLGSVAERVLRIACCPVLLVPAGDAK